MNKIGYIVLARMSSSRFPGKVLYPINGKCTLLRIKEALEKKGVHNNLVVATSTENSDDDILNWCNINNVKCYRGSLKNVARRFYEAAISFEFEAAVRINADNVFIDTNVLGEVCSHYPLYDFVSNVDGRTFPKGMSFELIRTSVLGKFLTLIELNDDYMEHVLSIFYKSNDIEKKYVYNKKILLTKYKDLSFDTKSDLQRINKVIKEVDKGIDLNKIICVN